VRVTNGTNHDVDLDNGRILPAGGRPVDVQETDYIKELLDAGLLRDASEQHAPATDNAAQIAAAADHPAPPPTVVAPGIVEVAPVPDTAPAHAEDDAEDDAAAEPPQPSPAPPSPAPAASSSPAPAPATSANPATAANPQES
jgi:hypothetical protein